MELGANRLPPAGIRPQSRALPVTVSGTPSTATMVPLRANIPIPDNDELNWGINVVDLTGLTVVDVALELQDLWHEHASDLTITLHHGTNTVDVVQGNGGSKTFGVPRQDRFPHLAVRQRQLQPEFTDDVEGDGYTYSWGDLNTTNLALGQPTEQSTTEFGGVSSRAVDGDVRGFFSLSTVTHTGGHGENDPEPWWEVDVGSQFAEGVAPIGTIRVWNREQQVTRDEVQVVRLRASGALSPTSTFTLSFDHGGVSDTTPPISAAAVANRVDEALVVDPANPGQGHNESMQSSLEAMENLGYVTVTRNGPLNNNGYDWTITFHSPPGNLPELTVDISGMDPNPVPIITVVTQRNGTDNTYYNYKNRLEIISGRLFPAWVMVSNSSVGGAGLAAAKAASHFRRRLTDAERREQTVVLPEGVTGKYVRVQLEDDDFLSIAEVEVFADRFESLASYSGGSPIVAGRYQPEFSLVEGFGGAPIAGAWLLSIRDTVARSETPSRGSRPVQLQHGTGGLHAWSLTLTCSDGSERTYHSDVMLTIKTMPFYGALFLYNATEGTLGDMIEPVGSLSRYLSKCYGNCDSRFGVGVPLSTDPDGSVADPTNRVDITNAHAVVYVPTSGWVGTDRFTYTVLLGSSESERVDAQVHVRECRLDCANEVFDDVAVVDGVVSIV